MYGLSKQFHITNATPTPRGANSMKHVQNARNMDRAVCRFVEALSNSRSFWHRGLSTASVSSTTIKAANDQWQDQTTEKRSEALIGWGYWRTKSKRVLVTKNGWRGGDGVAIAIGGYASEEVYYIEAVIELDRLITWKWKRRRRSL